jgi:hypothetical protein
MAPRGKLIFGKLFGGRVIGRNNLCGPRFSFAVCIVHEEGLLLLSSLCPTHCAQFTPATCTADPSLRVMLATWATHVRPCARSHPYLLALIEYHTMDVLLPTGHDGRWTVPPT